jgi:hypothetical protein
MPGRARMAAGTSIRRTRASTRRARCDCGTAWVSRGPIAWNAPGIVGFTRERWLERRRRLRRAVAGE